MRKKHNIPIELFSDVYHETKGSQKKILEQLNLTVKQFEEMMALLKENGFDKIYKVRNTTIPERELLLGYLDLKKSDVDIAKIFDCSTDQVREWYSMYRIEKPIYSEKKGNPQIEKVFPIGTAAERAKSIAALKGALEWRSVSEIAKKCGVNDRAMLWFLKNLGIKSESIYGLSEETPSLSELYTLFIKRKMTIDAVAKKKDVSWKKASRWHDKIMEYESRMKKLM